MKYTIKSVSDEGIYYLVNGWNKYKTFWISQAEFNRNHNYYINNYFFKTKASAKSSLTKLLKVMPDYKTDVFSMIEFK